MSELTAETMEKFWEEYEKHIRENSIKNRKGDYLIKDGLDPLKQDKYLGLNNETKVLFVLKESNEKPVKQEDKTVRTVFGEKNWFGLYQEKKTEENAKNPKNDVMLTKMVRMYEYIVKREARKNDESLKDSKHKVDYIKKKKPEKEEVYNFAFINISKRGNGTDKSDDKKIKEILDMDAPLLRKQVEYLVPDVVVIGGKNIAEEVEDKIIKKACLEKMPIVIRVKHFSRMGYEEFVDECDRKGL